jgi:LmbE family N-acetylglucosaminyl deacetylase
VLELSLPPGPLSVVCLAAHPDDIEIGVGGTLLALSARGEVTARFLTFTGSSERRAEAIAAAQAFLPGTSTAFHDFPDGRLPVHWSEVKEGLHAFAATFVDADLVLAPPIRRRSPRSSAAWFHGAHRLARRPRAALRNT